ncbi:hypothetical protein K1T71_011762 [Dendrolimus kikuchii]|uniref:Uncharacterized protein n=1 Tax=Dendrolimus kikuchii TaxID=765133 RepID=A0ACC1CM06_9NEOP|nr:hypothetical protein K1T71_011762 [Dendrolimus kikuchii]
MYFCYKIVKYCLCILFILICIYAEDIPDDIIPVLYSKYIEAIKNVSQMNFESQRRLFRHEREYRIHVKRLREVNGFKTHNLLIKEENKKGNPIIYINNPVETKIPHAFLTLEEFKKVLTNRVKKGTPALITRHDKGNNNIARIGTFRFTTKAVKFKATNNTTINIKTNKTVIKPADVLANLVKEKEETIPNIHITRESTSMRNLKENTNRSNKTDELTTSVQLSKSTINTVRATSTTKLVTKETDTMILLTQPGKEKNLSNLIEGATTIPNKLGLNEELTTIPLITMKIVGESAVPKERKKASTTETITAIDKVSINDNLEQEKSTDSVKIVKSSTSITTKTTRPKPSRPYVFMGGFE